MLYLLYKKKENKNVITLYLIIMQDGIVLVIFLCENN